MAFVYQPDVLQNAAWTTHCGSKCGIFVFALARISDVVTCQVAHIPDVVVLLSNAQFICEIALCLQYNMVYLTNITLSY